MGAPTAQVQPSQSSAPASKGAGQSASSEAPAGKGGRLASMSGQPTMGQPNTNGNTNLAPIDPNLGASQNPLYANTTGGISKNTITNTDGQPIGKMGGSAGSANNANEASRGKGSQNIAEPQRIEF